MGQVRGLGWRIGLKRRDQYAIPAKKVVDGETMRLLKGRKLRDGEELSSGDVRRMPNRAENKTKARKEILPCAGQWIKTKGELKGHCQREILPPSFQVPQ